MAREIDTHTAALLPDETSLATTPLVTTVVQPPMATHTLTTEELLAEREKTHGSFANHARVTCKIKDVLAEEIGLRIGRGQRPLSFEQREALDMIVHKIGRIIAGDSDFHDHWDDIAGYAKLCSKP